VYAFRVQGLWIRMSADLDERVCLGDCGVRVVGGFDACAGEQGADAHATTAPAQSCPCPHPSPPSLIPSLHPSLVRRYVSISRSLSSHHAEGAAATLGRVERNHMITCKHTRPPRQRHNIE